MEAIIKEEMDVIRVENDFKERAELAYQEIKKVLQNHQIDLDFDEGDGFLFHDTKSNKTLTVSGDLGKYEPWNR